jgi:hypothetical protein
MIAALAVAMAGLTLALLGIGIGLHRMAKGERH